MSHKFIFLTVFIWIVFSCKKSNDTKTFTTDINEEEVVTIAKDTLFYLFETIAESMDKKKVNLNVVYRFTLEKKDSLYQNKDKITELNNTIIKPEVNKYIRNVISNTQKDDLKNFKDQIDITKLNSSLSQHGIELVKLSPTVINRVLVPN